MRIYEKHDPSLYANGIWFEICGFATEERWGFTYTIDECLSEFSGDLEFDKAVDIVKKLYNANTTKSPNALINNIKNKLFNKGFSEDVVRR